MSLNFIVPPHTESFGFGRQLRPPCYLERLIAHMSAAEQIGAVGAFVYEFPVAMDPWLATFDVLTYSTALEPIVAVRAHQEGAQSVARRVVDLAYRFERPTHINVVAGATRPSRSVVDLDDKVAARRRLGQFAADLRADIDGRLGPAERRPLLVTPSSATPGVVTADCVLMMARPRTILADDIARLHAEQGINRIAMLVGVVVRATEEQAWASAAELYRADRRQVVAGRMFMSQVLSSEHTASYALAEQREVHDQRLWYGAPARGIDAPKLVGSVTQVADWLRSCRDIGVTDVIIDLVPDPAEYQRIGEVFALRS